MIKLPGVWNYHISKKLRTMCKGQKMTTSMGVQPRNLSQEIRPPPRLQTSLERKSRQKQEVPSLDKLKVEADPYSKMPQGLETSYADECKIISDADPYSKEPQGLETSYADECAANQSEGDRSVSVSSYGSESQTAQTEERESTRSRTSAYLRRQVWSHRSRTSSSYRSYSFRRSAKKSRSYKLHQRSRSQWPIKS